jgi:hypothetical protein
VAAARKPAAVVRGDCALDGIAEDVVDAIERDQRPPLGGGWTGAACVYVYSVVVGV